MLLFISLLAIGRLIKEIAWPPDRYIPLVTFIVAVVGAIMLGDPSAVSFEAPEPEVRLAFIGVVVWLVAWLSHKLVLHHFEEWITNKVKSIFPGAKAKEEERVNPDVTPDRPSD
jgi:hypothetical protein